MSERYLKRAVLGPQQFPLNCPVKLAAGALLEDTRQPRLVAQLKFTGSKATVTALAVTLHCEGGQGADLTYRYENLSAAPGQSFGQYTAVVLPAGTTAFRVTVDEVVFKNGAVWNRQDAEAQEQARQEAAAEREAKRRQAKAEAAEKAAAVKASAEEKLARKKAEAQRKSEEKQAAAPAGEATSKGKGKIVAIVAAVLVVVVIAGIILVPKLTKDDQTTAADPMPEVTVEPTPKPTPTPTPTPTPKPAKTDLNETGNITAVYIQRDESGYYSLMPNVFIEYLPENTITSASIVPDLGDDILPYLKDSCSFAWLVATDSIFGDGTMYQGNGDTSETVCVLALDGREYKLVGYFLGVPEQYDENTIRIDLIECDYDLLPLYAQERDAFEADRDFLYENYIAPNSDFEALGAKYYLSGYYTCDTGNLEDDDGQAYHLWQEAVSEQVKDFAGDIRHLENRLSQDYNHDSSTMFFLLLDKNYQPIGITWQ